MHPQRNQYITRTNIQRQFETALHNPKRTEWYSFTGTLLILHVSGPMSAQLVVSTALARAGPIGAITAFMLWNVPGLIVLIIFCGVVIASFVDPYNVQSSFLVFGVFGV